MISLFVFYRIARARGCFSSCFAKSSFFHGGAMIPWPGL
jgi:hypothetical protein